MQFSSIWAIDRTLSGATILGQSEPRSNGNEGVLHILQSSSITGTSPSACLMSYPEHSFGESYSSAEKQSVYSTAPADWVILANGYSESVILSNIKCTICKFHNIKTFGPPKCSVYIRIMCIRSHSQVFSLIRSICL